MTKRLKRSMIQTMILPAIIFLIASCGDPQQEQDGQATQRERNKQTEPTMAEVIVDQTGEDVFYDGDNYFSDEDWAEMKSLTDNIGKLREESEDNTVERDALLEIFQEHGFETIDQGSQVISEYAELQDLLLNLAMRSNSLQTERMMGDDEGVESVTNEIRQTLYDRTITKEDLLSIDANLDIIGQAVAVQFIIRSAQ